MQNNNNNNWESFPPPKMVPRQCVAEWVPIEAGFSMLQQVGGLESWTNRWWCFHGFGFPCNECCFLSSPCDSSPSLGWAVTWGRITCGAWNLCPYLGCHWLDCWLDYHLSRTGSQMIGLLGTLNTLSAMRQWRGPGAPPVSEESFRCGNCDKEGSGREIKIERFWVI